VACSHLNRNSFQQQCVFEIIKRFVFLKLHWIFRQSIQNLCSVKLPCSRQEPCIDTCLSKTDIKLSILRTVSKTILHHQCREELHRY
jgi:hypothetical protein